MLRSQFGFLINQFLTDSKNTCNDNQKLSNNVTACISSWQVDIGHHDIAKYQQKHKIMIKKRNEKGRSATVNAGDSIVKKVKGINALQWSAFIERTIMRNNCFKNIRY